MITRNFSDSLAERYLPRSAPRPHLKRPTSHRARLPLLVTDAAITELVRRRATQRGRSTQSLLVVRDALGQLALVLDEPGSDDLVFAHAGEPILAIADQLKDRFDGQVLDYCGAAGQLRFALDEAATDL